MSHPFFPENLAEIIVKIEEIWKQIRHGRLNVFEHTVDKPSLS